MFKMCALTLRGAEGRPGFRRLAPRDCLNTAFFCLTEPSGTLRYGNKKLARSLIRSLARTRPRVHLATRVHLPHPAIPQPTGSSHARTESSTTGQVRIAVVLPLKFTFQPLIFNFTLFSLFMFEFKGVIFLPLTLF